MTEDLPPLWDPVPPGTYLVSPAGVAFRPVPENNTDWSRPSQPFNDVTNSSDATSHHENFRPAAVNHDTESSQPVNVTDENAPPTESSASGESSAYTASGYSAAVEPVTATSNGHAVPAFSPINSRSHHAPTSRQIHRPSHQILGTSQVHGTSHHSREPTSHVHPPALSPHHNQHHNTFDHGIHHESVRHGHYGASHHHEPPPTVYPPYSSVYRHSHPAYSQAASRLPSNDYRFAHHGPPIINHVHQFVDGGYSRLGAAGQHGGDLFRDPPLHPQVSGNVHPSSPFYNGLDGAPPSTATFSAPGGHFDASHHASHASTPATGHDGRQTSHQTSHGPLSGSRLFPNARAPSPRMQSHGHHDASSPARPPVSPPTSPTRRRIMRGVSVLVHRDQRGSSLKTHASAVKELSNDKYLDFLPISDGSDPVKLAEHYASTDLVIEMIIKRLVQYDMLDPFMMPDSSASGLTGSPNPDVCILEVAHNVKQPAIAAWILSTRNTWDAFDIQSDAWGTEFFLNCLAPALREEVLHETADYDEHYYSAIVVAWIAMRKVFSASFQNLGVLEKMLTGFDISVYPKENVVKASHDLTAATKALKVVHQIPHCALNTILRGMCKSQCTEFNNRCFHLMTGSHEFADSKADVDTLALGREIRTTLSTCVSWYRSYLQA
eukprot:scaffold249328_cov81-Cyclotella_meneghiniana.AAC.1